MATIYYKLSPKEVNNQHQIIIRFVHGKNFDKFTGTKIFIPSKYWKGASGYSKIWEISRPSFRNLDAEQKQLISHLNSCRESLTELSSHILNQFLKAGAGKNELVENWLEKEIDNWHKEHNKESEVHFVDDDLGSNIKRKKAKETEFFEALDYFIENHKMSDGRCAHYECLKGMLQRFQAYRKTNLTFDGLDVSTLKDFEKYLYNEYDLYRSGKLDKVLESLTAKQGEEENKHGVRISEARGKHTVVGIMKRFRSFVRWANGKSKIDKPLKPYTTNNPFDDYPIGDSSNEEDYTTPYFLTLDERRKLLSVELPECLERQRDIFVFQCVIGCRISDLYKLTKDSIVNGCVEYIPRKTKEKRPVVVRVPLNNTALQILDKYKDLPDKKLLPFISEQKYNDDLKEIFKIAELTRLVTVIDSKSGDQVQRPLNELASSHMARRTFIGNLYNAVKDPDLIAELSGHKKGSRAFRRYRAINEDTKKELVSIID